MKDCKFPDLSGPLYAYLGHFRNGEVKCEGHNINEFEDLEPATSTSWDKNANRLGQETGQGSVNTWKTTDSLRRELTEKDLGMFTH